VYSLRPIPSTPRESETACSYVDETVCVYIRRHFDAEAQYGIAACILHNMLLPAFMSCGYRGVRDSGALD